jgi:hypothetical protein
MSIKRGKQRTFGSQNDSGGEDDKDDNYFAKVKEPEKTWANDVQGKPDDAFVPYSMATRFAKGALVSHPKFGKGIVTATDATNVVVLFESGPKKLGHATG